MKRLVVLSSYVATSRVGGSVALLAGPALGVEPMLIPTTLLGRHPGLGPPGGGGVADDVFTGMIEGAEANGALDADAVLTGYFASAEQVGAAARFIDRARTHNPDMLVVVDPIMGDEARGLYVKEAVADAIETELIGRADLATPNRWEFARSWAGCSHKMLDHPDLIAGFASEWPRALLVTSTPAGQDEVGAIFSDKDGAWYAGGAMLDGDVPNGAGDMLTLSVACGLLAGASPDLVLARSIGFVHALLARAQTSADPMNLPLGEAYEILMQAQDAKISRIR